MSAMVRAIAVAGILAGAAIVIWPPAGLPPDMVKPAGLVLATIALLATAALPEYVIALLFYAVAMLFTVAPADIIFSGFHSAALWLVLGGLIIGVGVKRTGLAVRIAARISQLFGTRYWAIITGTAVMGLVLAFLMPSTMSRVLLLMPIVLAMADRFGFTPGRPGRTAMILAMSTTTMLPAFAILPATVPGVIVAGGAESVFGVSLTYGTYLVQNFPVLGLLKAVFVVLTIGLLFPDVPETSEVEKLTSPMSGEQRLMALFLIVALALWALDFLHHISPAWIALGIAALMILPFVGLLSKEAFSQDVNYGSVLYVSAVLGLGGLISQSGLGGLLADLLLSRLPLGHNDPAGTFAAVTALGVLIGPLATQPGVPLVMMPLTETLHNLTGISYKGLLAMQVAGMSTVLLPYQMPPLVVAWSVGGIRMRDGTKVVLIILVATILILLPLQYWWLRTIGIL